MAPYSAWLVLIGVLLASCVWAAKPSPNKYGRTDTSSLKAVAVLASDNNSKVKGTVEFRQISDHQVIIEGTITGLKDGQHGLHVHESGDRSNGCTSMGAHFNPTNKKHGSPSADAGHRHVGDFGNIQSKGGKATFRITDRLVTLSKGVNSIVQRGLIVHEKVDDLGKGGNAESLKTGNAGGRLACGVIRITK